MSRRQRLGQYANMNWRALLGAGRSLLRRHAARELAPIQAPRVRQVTRQTEDNDDVQQLDANRR